MKQASIESSKTVLKIILLGLLFCAFYVAVWSGGRTPVPVSGTVSYQGNPVANVTVICIGRGNDIATGTTDASGNFAFLTTRNPEDGAFPGTYTVAVTPTSQPLESAVANYSPPPSPPFPSKYLSTETSPLKISVTESGENFFHLELMD